MAIVFDHDVLYTRAPEDVLPEIKPGTPPWVRIEEVLRQAGISSLPVDVRLDGQGRIRKLQSREDNGKLMASSASPPGTAPPGVASDVVTATIEYFDFDAAVYVEIPPASQVTDFEALISRTGR